MLGFYAGQGRARNTFCKKKGVFRKLRWGEVTRGGEMTIKGLGRVTCLPEKRRGCVLW